MVVVWPRVLAAEVLALSQPSGSYQRQEDGGQVGNLQTSPLTLLGALLWWPALLTALPGLLTCRNAAWVWRRGLHRTVGAAENKWKTEPFIIQARKLRTEKHLWRIEIRAPGSRPHARAR